MSLASLALGFQWLLAVAAVVAVGFLMAAGRRNRLALRPLVVLLACLAAGWGLEGIRVRDRGVEACAAEERRLGAAVELYGQNNGAWPDTLEVLIPVYFTSLPECPVAQSPYEAGYEHSEERFTLVCRGRHHPGPGGAPEDYPRYTSATGSAARP